MSACCMFVNEQYIEKRACHFKKGEKDLIKFSMIGVLLLAYNILSTVYNICTYIILKLYHPYLI